MKLEAGTIHTPHDEGMTFVTDSDTISVNERQTEFYLKSEADKVIAEHRKFGTPKTLEEFNLKRPPQSWCYTFEDKENT